MAYCSLSLTITVVMVMNMMIMITGIVLLVLTISEMNDYSPEPLGAFTIFIDIFPGLFVLVTSIIGFFAGRRASFRTILVFLFFIHVALVLPIVALCKAYMKNNLDSILDNVRFQFQYPEDNVDKIAYLEQKYSCCGDDGPNSYVNRGVGYPNSCYKSAEQSQLELFSVGCMEAVEMHAINNRQNTRVINWMLLVLEICALFSTVQLFSHLTKLYPNDPILEKLRAFAEWLNGF